MLQATVLAALREKKILPADALDIAADTPVHLVASLHQLLADLIQQDATLQTHLPRHLAVPFSLSLHHSSPFSTGSISRPHRPSSPPSSPTARSCSIPPRNAARRYCPCFTTSSLSSPHFISPTSPFWTTRTTFSSTRTRRKLFNSPQPITITPSSSLARSLFFSYSPFFLVMHSPSHRRMQLSLKPPFSISPNTTKHRSCRWPNSGRGWPSRC